MTIHITLKINKLIIETHCIVKNCTKTGVYKAPKSWNTTILENINTIEKITEENKACAYYTSLLDEIKKAIDYK